MSKGSKQRPTDKKAYDNNYDKIFGKKQPEEIVTLERDSEGNLVPLLGHEITYHQDGSVTVTYPETNAKLWIQEPIKAIKVLGDK